MVKKIFFTILFFASMQFPQDKSPKIASDFLIADSVAVMSKNEILPGREDENKVEFDSAIQFGKTRSSVRIISNAPIHPKTHLNIFNDVIE